MKQNLDRPRSGRRHCIEWSELNGLEVDVRVNFAKRIGRVGFVCH